MGRIPPFLRRAARRWVWLAATLALLVGVLLIPAIRRRQVLRQVPLLDGSTATIVPGIHLLGNLGPSAAYAVDTKDGVILIDAGLDADAQILKSELRKLGL